MTVNNKRTQLGLAIHQTPVLTRTKPFNLFAAHTHLRNGGLEDELFERGRVDARTLGTAAWNTNSSSGDGLALLADMSMLMVVGSGRASWNTIFRPLFSNAVMLGMLGAGAGAGAAGGRSRMLPPLPSGSKLLLVGAAAGDSRELFSGWPSIGGGRPATDNDGACKLGA